MNFSAAKSFDQNGDVLKYDWDFGDGLSDTAFNPTHIYLNGGNFIVTLIAYNVCSADTLIQQISLNNIPVTQARFSTTQIIWWFLFSLAQISQTSLSDIL